MPQFVAGRPDDVAACGCGVADRAVVQGEHADGLGPPVDVEIASVHREGPGVQQAFVGGERDGGAIDGQSVEGVGRGKVERAVAVDRQRAVRHHAGQGDGVIDAGGVGVAVEVERTVQGEVAVAPAEEHAGGGGLGLEVVRQRDGRAVGAEVGVVPDRDQAGAEGGVMLDAHRAALERGAAGVGIGAAEDDRAAVHHEGTAAGRRIR